MCVDASCLLLNGASEDRPATAIRVVADGGSLFARSVNRRLIEGLAPRLSQALQRTVAVAKTGRRAEALSSEANPTYRFSAIRASLQGRAYEFGPLVSALR